ncbi:MAG: outer membrane lipoprotein LolB [Woeseiaceae bacterium]|nr:outer membrane lipoprotein LolB [Woeseiaceae bacterium]NNL64134.1 outer membrane lipoprotein LolB [Woeseiaceae bacterium]
MLRRASLVFALLVLAGCATLPASIQLPAMDTWETRNAVLGALRNWQFRGRIAVKAVDEGFNGRFDWAQQGDAFDASVGGPLGIGTVRIDGEGDTVRLTDKDGTETRLENAETDLYWRYGWTIPVTSLRYWALGIPDPAVSAETEVDEKGRLRRLEQGGWTVTISRYAEGGGRQMPRILTATNPDTRVRMVIDRWSFFEN